MLDVNSETHTDILIEVEFHRERGSVYRLTNLITQLGMMHQYLILEGEKA